jgi:hypothetical protein
VKTCRGALGKNLPAHPRSIVEAQLEQIQEAHNNIRCLRDQAAH